MELLERGVGWTMMELAFDILGKVAHHVRTGVSQHSRRLDQHSDMASLDVNDMAHLGDWDGHRREAMKSGGGDALWTLGACACHMPLLRQRLLHLLRQNHDCDENDVAYLPQCEHYR